nr:serine acetyltransferase [uncultured Novosphingobium sp.]
MLSQRTSTRSSARSTSSDGTVPRLPAAAAPGGWSTLKADYRRHGGTLTSGAFIALSLYRYGRWGRSLRNPLGRVLVSRTYGFAHVFVANLTKIWIPPATTLGRDFHIVNNEGSLSIHPESVIGDRLGVMHNVTIGSNMREGAPVIGDDVFIGVNSTVLGAIRVGDRVRIAANTAVTTDVPPDSIVVGSPARIYPRLGPLR